MSSLKFGTCLSKNGSITPSNNSSIKGNVKEVALYDAIKNGKIEEMKQLLSSFTFLQNPKDVFMIKTFIKFFKNRNPVYIEAIDLLLQYNADLGAYTKQNNLKTQDCPDNDIFDDKETTFLFAMFIGDEKLVDLVLKYVSDVNMKDSQNRNAFFYLMRGSAATSTKESILEKLIAKEINLEEPEKLSGHYPLTFSVLRGFDKITKMLLDYKVSPNCQNEKDGFTPLHYAIKKGNREVINMLILHGCDFHIKNFGGVSAIDYSLNQNATSIYEQLAIEDGRKRKAKELEEKERTERLERQQQEREREIELEREREKEREKSNGEKKIENILEDYLNTSDNLITNKGSNNSSSKKLEAHNPNKGKQKEMKRIVYPMFLSNNSGVSEQVTLDFPCVFNNEEIAEKSKIGDYFKLNANPVLHIDISDDDKKNKLLGNGFTEKEEYIRRIETQNSNLNFLNNRIKELTNELERKNALIDDLQLRQIELEKYSDETNNYCLIQTQSLENLERENKELKNMLMKYQKGEMTGLNLASNQTEIESLDLKKIHTSDELVLEDQDSKGYKMELNAISSPSQEKNSRITFLENKFISRMIEKDTLLRCLTQDILDYREFVQHRVKSIMSTQESLIKLVEEAVAEVSPDIEVNLFGSHATGLCLHWSDIDLVLSTKKSYTHNFYTILGQLSKVINGKNWKSKVNYIESSTVPIIKIKASDQYKGMQIDISMMDNKHQGLKCVELVKSFLKEYEVLEPLTLAVKNLVKNAKLNDPFLGGISSYGIILMLVHFLQSQEEKGISLQMDEFTLGRLFLDFLKYHGKQFNHSGFIIYAYPPGAKRENKPELEKFYFMNGHSDLIIIDPLNLNNNVGKNTFQLTNLKMAFMLGYHTAHEDCECFCHFKDSVRSCPQDRNHCMLKRIYKAVKRFTYGDEANN